MLTFPSLARPRDGGSSGHIRHGRLVLSGTFSQWVEQGLRWHDRLEPVLHRLAERKKGVEVVKPVRGKGRDVRFREYAPLPDFLIRTAGMSVTVPAGAGAGAVSAIRSLHIRADVSGTRAAPDITLTSNLDQALKEVVGRQIQAQTARGESQLRAAIEATVGVPLAELTTSCGGLDEISKELSSRLSLGAEATKSKGGLGGFKLPF